MENSELDVFYQPRIDIHRNQIVGMEALARWTRDGNPVGPDKFIPVAEENNLIDALGNFVLHRACAQVAAMRNDGCPDLELGVNVSATQLDNPDLFSEFEVILADTGMPPHLLCLELTVSALMHHADRNVKLLQSFRRLGCKVAVDDFGTGYSSLNYFKRFPIDTLKIDRSFVIDLASSDEDGTIVTAVVRLAQTLGLIVVAEGVETECQEEVLRRLGCDEVQGYLYSHPMPYEALVEWLRERLAVSTVLRASR